MSADQNALSDEIGSVQIVPPKEPKPKVSKYTVNVAYENSITTSIIVITIIIIGVFMVWLLILIFNDTPPTTLAPCLPDKCATNIFSGVKRCPPPGESISYNTDVEVCNSRFVCDNAVTPLAVQLDGSTSVDGICPTNVECRCVQTGVNTVPTYITNTFSGVNGNPYTSLANQRLTFTQTLTPSLSTITNVTTEFYGVPSTWLARSSPGCVQLPAVIDFKADSNQREILKNCFNDINPCLQGALALVPSSASLGVNQRDMNSMAYSCVRAKPCVEQEGLEGNPRNYILFRDYLSGDFLCYNVNDID
jgi:hypothetical protein